MLEISCFSHAPKGSKDVRITRPHAGSLTCDWLWHDDWEVMFHSFYSHVRTPLDFRIVKPFKKQLGDKGFVTRRREASCLLTTKQEYVLLPQREKCLNINGDYIEFRRVLSAKHIPHKHRRYDKILGKSLPFNLFFGTPFYNKNIFLSRTSFIVQNIKLT